MASTLTALPNQPRRASRSNSPLSPTLIMQTPNSTLGPAPSTKSRPIVTGLRSRSPSSNLASSPSQPGPSPGISPGPARRSSALYFGSDSTRLASEGAQPGVMNMNRWSQSTGSSKRSSAIYEHGSSSSRPGLAKRLSGSIGNFASGSLQSISPGGSHHPQRSRSPARSVPRSNPTPPVLPPIATLSSLSQAVDAAESPSNMSLAQTPLSGGMQSPMSAPAGENQDYFGGSAGQWSPQSPRKRTSRGKRLSRGMAKIDTNSPKSPGRPDSVYRAPESKYSPRSAHFSHRNPDRRSSHQDRSERRSSHQDRSRRSSGKAPARAADGESSASEQHDKPAQPRSQRRRAPSQKALLSKALAKANHAVVLDGKQNIEGAILAYGDACNLLRQVMVRSSGEDDRKKLEAVRNTYRDRIAELQNFGAYNTAADNKALPQRPERDSGQTELTIVSDDDDDDAAGATQLPTQHPPGQDTAFGSSHYTADPNPNSYIPPRRQSLQTSAYRVEGRDLSSTGYNQYGQPAYEFGSPLSAVNPQSHPLHNPDYVPKALSPRPSQSPAITQEAEDSDSLKPQTEQHTSWLNTINESSGSTSSSSTSSSVHSRRSSVGLRRKRIRHTSGNTEAEFDAALDAAIETAYDEGFEPDDEADDEQDLMYPKQRSRPPSHDAYSSARRNVELAKERAREAEREAAVAEATDRERRRLQTRQNRPRDSLDDGDGEEEERLLEEMTRDFLLDTEYDGMQQKSALPRNSDSSGFSGRTWGGSGSVGSNPTSKGTSLSTVAETMHLPSLDSKLGDPPTTAIPPPPPPMLHPPPAGALPKLPSGATTPTPLVSATSGPLPLPPAPPDDAPPSPATMSRLAARTSSSPGVRDRRLSGMKARQLKIDTSSKPTGSNANGPKTQPTPQMQPLTGTYASYSDGAQSATFAPDDALHVQKRQHAQDTTPMSGLGLDAAPTSASFGLGSSRKGSFPLMSAADTGDAFFASTAPLTNVVSGESDTLAASAPGSPARLGSKTMSGLRKNFSSSSLRSRALSAGAGGATAAAAAAAASASTAGHDTRDGHETSPNTSISSVSSVTKIRRLPSPAVPVMPPPAETSFLPRGQPMGGIYLFDCAFHSTNHPGQPNLLTAGAPLPLEPCPESALLRPFWFLRAIYQTISHPRGGYLTTRLFVPRDIWRVKNIKLKNVEEKVSTCDLLTAALLKLGRIDTFNADAVLEEMQFLENVMERAQANLTKKLGNEVGVHGALASFKGSMAGVGGAASALAAASMAANAAGHDDSASNSEAIYPSAASTGSKNSYLKSWRKLRSKNSSAHHHHAKSIAGLPSLGGSESNRDGSVSIAAAGGDASSAATASNTISSVPMTATQNPRFPKRDVSSVQCVGPNPSYMGALARLCDAAQVIDQIARQCEDPGLKHSSPTHVGLELSARHAAEFFAFYICRFVFSDIGLMLDKYIKRGSEWVLS